MLSIHLYNVSFLKKPMQVMQQEGFQTELSEVSFVSCFKPDYSVHFKQKANQLLSRKGKQC